MPKHCNQDAKGLHEKNCALKRFLDTIKVEHDKRLVHDKLLCKRFYVIKFFKGTIKSFEKLFGGLEAFISGCCLAKM